MKAYFPLSMKWLLPPSFLLLLFGSMSFFYFDQKIASFIHHFFAPSLITHLASFLISPELHTLLWPCLFLYARFFRKDKQLLHLSYTLSFALFFTFIISACLKWLLGRARPELFFEEHTYGFFLFQTSSHFLSFPSSHASIAFILASFFSPFFRFSLTKSIAFLIASLLSISRLALEKHYLSDISWGALLGILMSFLTPFLLRRFKDIFPLSSPFFKKCKPLFPFLLLSTCPRQGILRKE